jgi:predicted glycoside hydrolase/deacetylase ChbG (UPF0249 family)
VINADDLGYSVEVNKAIFSLMDRGHVTSASLLMNAPATEQAIAQIPHYPHLSFGIHLNITEFAPLSRHPGLAPLLSAETGEFSGLARRIKLSRSVREGVFAEWCAQIDRALQRGVPVSHLDSHHHAHTEPALFLTLKRVQRKYGIRKVRITRNVYDKNEAVSPIKKLSKFLWNMALRHFYLTKAVDHFTSFATFFRRIQEGLALEGSLELMCHPGGPGFSEETRLLEGPWQQAVRSAFRLISYNDL